MPEPAQEPATRTLIALLDGYPIDVDLSEWEKIAETSAGHSSAYGEASMAIVTGMVGGRGHVALVYGREHTRFAGKIVSLAGEDIASAVFAVCSTFDFPLIAGVDLLAKLQSERIHAAKRIR